MSRFLIMLLSLLLFACSCGVFDNPLHLPTWGAEFLPDENHDLDEGESTESGQNEDPQEDDDDKPVPDVEADD